MKGEGLTCVSFEAGQKRMTQGAESSGTGSLQTCLLCPFSLQTQWRLQMAFTMPLAAPTVIEIETYPILPHFIVAIIGSSS